MRIISGQKKGHVIHPPKGLPVRPTTDRAKESLFNILSNHFDFETLDVLDLFSGTGNIAYECCSREAASVLAVDQHFKCVQFIRETAKQLGFTRLKALKMDAFACLKNLDSSFDLIFADAPYAHPDIFTIPRLVNEYKRLSPSGWLVVEHEANLELNTEIGFFDKRIYGQSAFSFFKNSLLDG